MPDDPGRPEFGSEAWKAEKAWLRSTRRARAALIEATRCPHGRWRGTCRACDPIDPDKIPF